MGGIRLNSRAQRVIVAAVAELLDPTASTSRRWVRSHIGARLRLLVGMVRANRPWQLFFGLSRALAGIAALSIAALTAWLIVDHELWERPSSTHAKALARLYHTTTAVSVVVFDPHVLRMTLGHTPTWADRVGIAWFSTSAAMVGGALGSGLENDRVVQQAAYGERQRPRSSSRGRDGDQA